MADNDERRLAVTRQRTATLVVVLACVAPLGTAALALALASGVLAEPGFATAMAVTALLLLLV